MINKGTMKLIKETIRDYVNEHYGRPYQILIPADNVYVVRFNKTSRNWNALVSTTFPDGMYYELTYYGDKGELRLDVYKRIDSQCIRGEEK